MTTIINFDKKASSISHKNNSSIFDVNGPKFNIVIDDSKAKMNKEIRFRKTLVTHNKIQQNFKLDKMHIDVTKSIESISNYKNKNNNYI